MWRKDGIKGIKHLKVCILQIVLMYIYYLMDFYYLLLFIIIVLSLDSLRPGSYTSA